MMKSISFKFTQVALTNIDREDRLTDFSIAPSLDALKDSIEEIGVIHPVVLMNSAEHYKIICGHRRVAICQTLGLAAIPARVVDSDLSAEAMLALNLTENRAHRSFSDIETGLAINKLASAGVSVENIIGKYMPILGLERSKKLCQEYSGVSSLEMGLQNLLHEMNVPLRIFSSLLQWSVPCRAAAENLFSNVRPGINKWRELLELAGEIARIENQSPGEILRRPEIQSLLAQNDLQPHEKYDQIVQAMTAWRYPVLSDLRKKIARQLDQLSLGPRTKIRIQDSLETDEIKIEIKGRDQKSLVDEVERLANASRSDAMGELLRILRELK